MIKYDIKKISEKNIRMIPRKMVEISEQINQITARKKYLILAILETLRKILKTKIKIYMQEQYQ